ncbi:MAG TPA: undecaprenyl-diphosphate phosphatase [Candidatus Woesebacteria bacterium]|nr:undecaprenyl-diphosphate phosphatase [Candidatus Woesebacteria bacterium]
MQIWQAFILGIIEGLTEFLPISSTFHLIFVSQFLNITNSNFLKVFEVFIQSGAILAVLFLYGKELWTDRSLIKKLILSFIPTAIIGFLFHSIIKNLFFETNWLMLTAFISVGIIFILYEKRLKNKAKNVDKEIKDLNNSQSLLIGLGQAVAVIPGVSRSGAVMLTMMAIGQSRAQAAKYSFLLAVPTICSAAALDILKLSSSTAISSQEIILLLVGFGTAFIVSLTVLKWFISFIQKHTLVNFGVYRLIIGFVLILIQVL